MLEVMQELKSLIATAKGVHRNEGEASFESIRLVDELARRNAAAYLGLSQEKLAVMIGLTPDKYWKRIQAGRVLKRFPQARSMVIAGEIRVSHLAAIAAKITEANSEMVFAGIRNKTIREVEAFMSRVDCDGNLMPVLRFDHGFLGDSDGPEETSARV